MSSPPPLLSRFVEDELARVAPLMEDVIQAVLSNRSGNSPSSFRAPQDKVLEHELMLALARNRPAVVQRFVDELRKRAQVEMSKAPSSAGGTRAPPAKLTLSLLDEAEVTSDVELSRVIEAINSEAEYELRELRAFTSALVGEESVSRETNPLHAENYAHALLAAGRALPLSRGHQLLFMRHASAPLAQAIRNTTAAACTRLESQGIEPSVYRTIVQPKSVAKRTVNQPGPVSQTAYAAAPVESVPQAPPAPVAPPPLPPPPPPPPAVQAPSISAHQMIQVPPIQAPPIIQSPSAAPAAAPVERLHVVLRDPTAEPPPPLPPLRINLTELRDSMPVPLDPPKREATPLDEALLKAEERLRLLPDGGAGLPNQAPAPGEQREQPLHSTGSRVDQQLIELLSRLFDAILANRRVPAPFQVLISRLHASALRVALREPDMLDAYSHPVWMFMDRLAFQGSIHGADGDPELAEALKVGQRLVDHISKEATQDNSLYHWALDQVLAYERHRFDERRKALAGDIETLRRMTGDAAVAASPEPEPQQQPMLDVQTMVTVPADLLNEAAADADDAARQLHEIQAGRWLNMFLQGTWRIVQLVWRGESAWLLADVNGHPETWAVRVGALQILHAEHLVKPHEPVSLVQKAAERVLNEMASNEADVPQLVQDTRI